MMSSCLSEWRQHYFRSFTLFRPFRGLDKGVKYSGNPSFFSIRSAWAFFF